LGYRIKLIPKEGPLILDTLKVHNTTNCKTMINIGLVKHFLEEIHHSHCIAKSDEIYFRLSLSPRDLYELSYYY
jgi:hypothetical protein